ncbi:MAG TPA: hypothetical protein VM618_05390 [Acidimicrobiia bacterium]|nr:hypothetical protein [Acidimicrobiia bacterium]
MGRPASGDLRLTWRLAVALAVSVAVAVPGCGDAPSAPGVEGEVTAEVSFDLPPGTVAVGDDGTVWVTASSASRPSGGRPFRHAVYGIDGERGTVVHEAALPHQMNDVAVGAGGVWMVGTDFRNEERPPQGTLVRLDPATGRVTDRLDLGEGAPSSVAVGHGSVWVTDSREDRVLRIDPEDVEVDRSIAVSGGPTSVAIDRRWAWVASPTTGVVHRIDPQTNVPSERVATGGLPSVVAAGGGVVWVSNYADEDLAVVDPDAVEVERTVDFASSPSRMAAVGERLAIVESEDQRLSLLAPGSDPVVLLEDRFFVDVAARDSTLWVVDHGDDRLVRVTLRSTE